MRARIDWKYLLGLELADPGFDHSVLCEFRARLLAGSAEERLLGKLLDACQARGLLKARGRQRTRRHPRPGVDPRAQPPRAGLGETLRAALNELAAVAPDWLRAAAPRAWYERYARRVEDGRLPRAAAEREAYARAVGEDGFALLDRLDRPETRRGAAAAADGRDPAPGLGPPLRAGGRGSSRRRRAAQGEGGSAARGRSRSSRPTTPRRASAPARAPPGSGTSST